MADITSPTDDPLLTALGARLAGIRIARNMTQAQLAAEAGLGLRTMSTLAKASESATS